MALDLRRVPNTVAILGDSYANFNSQPGGTLDAGTNSLYNSPLGIWSWADVFLRKRLQLVAVKGVGGQRAQDIAARVVTDILSIFPRPGYCIIISGANDGLQAVPFTVTVEAQRQACDTLIKAGIVPVLVSPPPTSGYYADNAHKISFGEFLHAQRKMVRTMPGVIYCDWRPYLVNPDSGVHPAANTSDLTHLNALGAAIAGKALADTLAPIVPAVDTLGSDYGDMRLLNTNPGMTTTSGAGASGTAGTGVTGTVPGGYSVNPLTSTVTCVSSLVSKAPLNYNQMNLAVSAGDVQVSVFANNAASTGQINVTPNAGGWQFGMPVFAECEFSFDTAAAFVNVDKIALRMDFQGINYATYDILQASSDPAWARQWMSGVLRTPSRIIPAGTTNVKATFLVKGVGSAQYTVNVGKMNIRSAA